jgi:hypothetical protein
MSSQLRNTGMKQTASYISKMETYRNIVKIHSKVGEKLLAKGNSDLDANTVIKGISS